jgi:glycosyltransferase involved in cell wall biosynthesis
MIRTLFNSFKNRRETVTVCIPVYNAVDFIADTIQSVLNQTHENLQILISVDLGTDQTKEIIQHHLEDRRIRLFTQRRRLGWIGNTNFLLAKVKTPYFCILPHDDLIEATFISKLLENLKEYPQAVASFCDIECFGNHQGKIIQESILGDAEMRLTDYLLHHYNAVLMRSLVRRKSLRNPVYFRNNKLLDFSADTIWGLELIMQGEVVRLPEILYKKRYHPASLHHQWQLWTDQKMLDAWELHCQTCLNLTLDHKFFMNQTVYLHQCVLARFTQQKANLWQTKRLKPYLENEKIVQNFIARLSETYVF